MRELNKRIRHLEVPLRMRHLSVSDEGYPVPYFVPWVDGKPEFRGMDGEKLGICVRLKRCWLCGHAMGKFMTFPIGPMCAVNRNTAEPPSHYDCANYGVRACPFLTQPRMRRNEKEMPEDGHVAGIGIKRNPGVTLLWVTKDYRCWRPRGGGVLFEIGDPVRVEFWAEGRHATHEEIMHSIDTGMPILREMAEKDGTDAVKQLELQYTEALKLVPRAA